MAYIFRGNLGLFNILVTRIANLMVFAMNIAMANTYVRFVSSVFVEKGAEVSGNSVKIANIFSCINIFIVVVNLFYPWMYYFDEANYYHRCNIEKMLETINIPVTKITTEMLREYLVEYQAINNCGKVTIDNIRRSLSTFFSWLEEEDYIIKSPMKRIHKVKSSLLLFEQYLS